VNLVNNSGIVDIRFISDDRTGQDRTGQLLRNQLENGRIIIFN
jgi:hypothetical protein